MPQPPVRILVTGGTIDKVHDIFTEGLSFETGVSRIPDILQTGRCDFPEVQQILQKDSLYFDDADREAVAQAIADAPEASVVVTHGTGTMGQTARFLADHISGKTVVLTGAMRPHAFAGSDGSFNIGGALVAAQLLPEGIYGVMNGRVFPAADLDKNTKLGRFDR